MFSKLKTVCSNRLDQAFKSCNGWLSSVFPERCRCPTLIDRATLQERVATWVLYDGLWVPARKLLDSRLWFGETLRLVVSERPDGTVQAISPATWISVLNLLISDMPSWPSAFTALPICTEKEPDSLGDQIFQGERAARIRLAVRVWPLLHYRSDLRSKKRVSPSPPPLTWCCGLMGAGSCQMRE